VAYSGHGQRRKSQRTKSKRGAAHREKPNPVRSDAVPSHQQNAKGQRSASRHTGNVSQWLDSAGSARALTRLAHDAVIICDPKSRIESWNPSAAQLYGWTAEEAAGKVIHILLDTKWPSSLGAANQALFSQGYWEGELDHRRKDGTRIVVESRQALLRDANGKPLLIKEINRDVTQQRRQLSYLRLLDEISASVNEARTIEEALRWLLTSICLRTKWCAARAIMFNADTDDEIQDKPVWFLSDEQRFGALRDAVGASPYFQQKGMAQRIFRDGQPVWIRDLQKEPDFASILKAISLPLHSAYAFPISLAPSRGVVIVLFSDAPKELDEAFTGTMSDVGRHLGRLFERLGAEEAQRALSISLMRAQDDERRRVARELHDSAGQYLSALALAIDAARSHGDALPPAATRKLEEATEIINRCSAEIRTLSHLLHPPLLEELGLLSAVNWYVEGFAERSGLKVDLQLPAELARFNSSVEITLFRALQECLTNIHRHSGSSTASVKIESDDGHLMLEVRDEGRGIEPEMWGQWRGSKKRAGVGLSGMRERLKDLGGTLEIHSNRGGTTVRATIPIDERPSASAAADTTIRDSGKVESASVGASD
jgi:PAS domain S-box-containing protein